MGASEGPKTACGFEDFVHCSSGLVDIRTDLDAIWAIIADGTSSACTGSAVPQHQGGGPGAAHLGWARQATELT
eukprot:492530-Pyramimonas_sp.AAC.1